MTLSLVRRAIAIPNPFSFEDQFLRSLAYFALVLAVVLLIALVTVVLGRILRRRLRKTLERTGFQINVAILLSRSVSLAVWTVGGALILYLLGVGLAPLAAFIGVVGLAASLSLQSVLQNLVAGVYLLAERPFRIGDVIAVVGPNGANHQGTVVDVQMRTTLLRSMDEELIMIPNSTIFTGVVTNRSAAGGYVSHLIATFPRETDPQSVRDAVEPLLDTGPTIVTRPKPELRVTSVTTQEWTANLSFWTETPDAATNAVLVVGRAFPDATITSGSIP